MKKIILIALAFAMTGFGIHNIGITDEERKMTVDHLEQTQARLENTITGLTEVQLNFKPTPESWSVAECVEHLAISENKFNGMLQVALKEPANAAMRDSVTMPDDKLIAMISSREKKFKTFESFEPSGKLGEHEEIVATFTAKRKENIEFVKTTQENLRNHYYKLPFVTLDGLQIILYMSGHTERHVAQMEAVIGHKDFPSKVE